MATFYLKTGDTLPHLEAVLSDDEDNPINLEGASARLRLHEPRGGGVALESLASVVDAEEGIVRYDWNDGDTDETGRFRLDFEVEYANGDSETFPSDGYHDLVISD